MRYNQDIFFDSSIPADDYVPITDKEDNYISVAELKETIQHHFKGNKSSGLSQLPLQLLKNLGTKGIEEVAHFLNKSAIDNQPPKTWRESKVVPLYKNKGNKADPSNYRSLAITPPFAKLFMAVINQRLTKHAKE